MVSGVAGIERLGTYAFRYADIKTTFNIYGDVVTDEMTTAGTRVSELAFQGNRVQTECKGF